MPENAYRTWIEATLIRVVRTAAAAALASIGAAVLFQDVHWDQVGGTAALAAIVTFLMCLAGLPEAHTVGPLEHYFRPGPPEPPDVPLTDA